jgi:hypothetical protein
MKTKRLLLFLPTLLLMLALVVGITSAQGGGLPGSGWYTGHTVANVGSGAATIIVTAYDSASSNTYSFTNNNQTVPQNGSVTWLPDNFSPALPAGFSGSAVVSSDQEIRAIVNVTNRLVGSLGTTGGEAAGQYRGVDQAADSIAFPLVKYQFPAGNPARKNTTLFLQNAGDSAAAITVDFVGTGCTPCSHTTPSIDPGKMVAVSASDAGAAAGFIGAATATSSVNIAGVFMETPVVENPVKQAQAANGFTPTDYDGTILVPVYKNAFGGRSTGLQVQNVGAVAVDLTVTWKGDSAIVVNGCPGETFTDNSNTGVAPGQSVTYLFETEANCLSSATVVATAASGTPLIAGTINEAFLPSAPPAGTPQQSTIYSAFPQSAATNQVSLPVVKDQFGNKTTGITCQNVGNATATNVVYSYVISAKQAGGTVGATHTTNAQTIAAGASQTLVNPSGTSALWNGAALPAQTLNAVTVTADQPIVCIANESVNFGVPSSVLSQDKNNYEGFNLP